MIARSPVPRQSDRSRKLGSWRAALQQAVHSPAELLQALGLAADVLPVDGSRPFPMRVPLGFVARMRRGDPADPLLRQVLPLADEARAAPGWCDDPVGDRQKLAAPGVVHKYAGRVLLVATGACAVHCRYCFRQHFPYSDETASRDRWRAALAYVAERTDVNEVILSGGDPLLLSTNRLADLTDRLRTLPHVKRLRIHSRVPVVLPERVNAKLLRWLEELPLQKVLVIHANHANEFDAGVDGAMAELRATGATLLNQSVLLAGINDSADAQVALAERAFSAGVMPYYLHLLDRVAGAAHFEARASDLEALQHELRCRLPGYLVPRLVREQAGAPYKLPVL